MRRHLISLAMVACSAALAAKAPVQERGANSLLIDAVAVDSHGMPVMDLKPAEVEVWISGYRVPIESIEGPTGAGWHDFKYDFSLAKMEFQYNPVFYIDDYLKERFLYEQRQKELKKR